MTSVGVLELVLGDDLGNFDVLFLEFKCAEVLVLRAALRKAAAGIAELAEPIFIVRLLFLLVLNCFGFFLVLGGVDV